MTEFGSVQTVAPNSVPQISREGGTTFRKASRAEARKDTAMWPSPNWQGSVKDRSQCGCQSDAIHTVSAHIVSRSWPRINFPLNPVILLLVYMGVARSHKVGWTVYQWGVGRGVPSQVGGRVWG